MSYRIIDKDYERCRYWMRQQIGASHVEEICIGLEKNGELIAATAFGWYNQVSMHQHIVVAPGERMTREFFWFMFYYPFEQVGVRMLISFNSTDNPKAARLAKHAGYRLHSKVKNGSPNGDMLLWTMTKDDCRPLRFKEAS